MVHGDLLLVVIGHLTIVLSNFDVGELHGHDVLTQGLEDQVSDDLETGILICQLWDSCQQTSWVFIEIGLSWG